MPDYVAMARDAARRAGFDPDVFVRQIQQESGFNPNARSPVGAQGIAQFMPDTARGMGIDPLDPAQALDAAARWMADLKRQFGSTALALAAYNAGPGAVQKYGGIPPFDETRAYIARILGPTTAEAADNPDQAQTGAGVDTSGDRPPSEFEPPSRTTAAPAAPTRATRMQARISELQQQAQAKQAEISSLLQPGPDETLSPESLGTQADVERANAARQNRVIRLNQAHQELTAINSQINSLSTDLANDADPKTTDPAVAAKAQTDLARAQVELEQQKLQLEAAKTAAAKANSPAAQRIADLEIKKAELGVAQAEVSLENARNPRAPMRAPQTPEEIAQARLNLQKTQQEIDLGAKKMLPQAQQVMQGLSDTITYLQGMYEKGQIELPQMNAYVQMAKDAADASLRGTTPAEEAAAKQSQKNAEKSLGLNILNQRLVSGAGLANTLMSAATGPHVMLRPGQTSLGVDPLEGLKALVDQLGGGAGVSDYGKSLLLGAQGAAPVGPQPAGL